MKVFLVLGLSALMSHVLNAEEAIKYEVPVSEELKEYASFSLPDFEKTIIGNKVTVEYTLPEILTGNEEKIELSGKLKGNKDEVVLKGKKGSAFCTGLQSIITCKISYDNLEIDENKVISVIGNISTSLQEFNGRLEVFRSFSTDPVGIITY